MLNQLFRSGVLKDDSVVETCFFKSPVFYSSASHKENLSQCASIDAEDSSHLFCCACNFVEIREQEEITFIINSSVSNKPLCERAGTNCETIRFS